MNPRSNPPRSDSGTGYGLPELPKAWWKAPSMTSASPKVSRSP